MVVSSNDSRNPRKRTASELDNDEIVPTHRKLIKTTHDAGDPLDNLRHFARCAFFSIHQKEYREYEYSLYESIAIEHPVNDSILKPDFIRDDGCIIYIRLVQCDQVIRDISTETIQLTMSALKLKKTILTTITIKPDINLFKMGNLTSKVLANCSEKTQTTIIKSSPTFLAEYFASKIDKPVAQQPIRPNQLIEPIQPIQPIQSIQPIQPITPIVQQLIEPTVVIPSIATIPAFQHIPTAPTTTTASKPKKTVVSKSKKKVTISNDTTLIDTTPIDTTFYAFSSTSWVSASRTRNFALENQLDDYLDIFEGKKSWATHEAQEIDESTLDTINTATSSGSALRRTSSNSSTRSSTDSFSKHLMSKGTQFESVVMKLLIEKVGAEKVVTICPNMINYYRNIETYESNTKQAMLNGVPYIYQAVLLNRTGIINRSYGMADLLVRSDHLAELIDVAPMESGREPGQTHYRAPKLNGDYHYVVVDIKWTTIEFNADGLTVRKTGSVPAFKCQLYIYNHALEAIQGYEPKTSYILGRKWKIDTTKLKTSSVGCFSRLGHIQYYGKDADSRETAIKAVQWLKDLKEHGHEWVLEPVPSNPYLYPNMSSSLDSSYTDSKERLADRLGEITMLWNCGVKNREIAHANGVYSWRDPKFNAKICGINGVKQAPTLDKIIAINQQTTFDSVDDRIKFYPNPGADNRWKQSVDLRITVDFELINNIVDDFSSMPYANTSSYLFMIGLSIQYKTNPYEYRMFLLSELSQDAEFQIVSQFYFSYKRNNR